MSLEQGDRKSIEKVFYCHEGAYFFEDYAHLITKVCTMCGGPTSGKWEDYFIRGNFCQKCNAKFQIPKSKTMGRYYGFSHR